jgi:type IV secretory pathway VirB6-like protein
MTTSVDTQDTRAPYSWVAPLISTVVTVPGGALAVFFAMFSAMICDPCHGKQADDFDQTYAVAFSLFLVVLLVALALLITSWVLPWFSRNTGRRIGYAFAAPACVLVGSLLFFSAVIAAGPGA